MGRVGGDNLDLSTVGKTVTAKMMNEQNENPGSHDDVKNFSGWGTKDASKAVLICLTVIHHEIAAALNCVTVAVCASMCE